MTPLERHVMQDALGVELGRLKDLCLKLEAAINDDDTGHRFRARLYDIMINVGVLFETVYPDDERVEIDGGAAEACVIALRAMFAGTHAPAFADA